MRAASLAAAAIRIRALKGVKSAVLQPQAGAAFENRKIALNGVEDTFGHFRLEQGVTEQKRLFFQPCPICKAIIGNRRRITKAFCIVLLPTVSPPKGAFPPIFFHQLKMPCEQKTDSPCAAGRNCYAGRKGGHLPFPSVTASIMTLF